MLQTVEVNGKTYAELLNGQPVYIIPTLGVTFTCDGEKLFGQVAQLRRENKQIREQNARLKGQLKRVSPVNPSRR